MNLFRNHADCRRVTALILIQSLIGACSLTSAADDVKEPTTGDNSAATTTTSVNEKIRKIDWNRAITDAQSISTSRQAQRREMSLPVPLLVPASNMVLSNMGSISVAPVKIITDDRGYASVSNTPDFDILIDASNRSFTTDDRGMTSLPDVFDGDFQDIDGGGEITIGRYGALYSIRVQCHDSRQTNCGSERHIREIIDVLQVSINNPTQ